MQTLPPSSGPSWQIVVFVSVIGIVVGASGVAAIIRYSEPDDALKIWAGLSGLVGILIGAGAVYFPASSATQQAQHMANQVGELAQRAQDRQEQAQIENEFWTRAATRLALEVPADRWSQIADDIPEFHSVRRQSTPS